MEGILGTGTKVQNLDDMEASYWWHGGVDGPKLECTGRKMMTSLGW